MFKLTENGVQRGDDGAFIPEDSRNSDWQEYQDWIALGNTPAAKDVPPAPVKQLTVEALAAALKLKGVLTDAELSAVKT